MTNRFLDGASVLLDMDGTLVDSHAAILASLYHALRAVGQEPDPAVDYSWVIGPPLHDVVGAILKPHTPERAEAAVAAYRSHYENGGMLKSPLFPGIPEVLDTLRDRGARLYLATSKPLHLARQILDAHGLTDRFTGLYGARPDDSGAEKPELIAGLIAQEGVDPARAVMVGDRRFDVVGAHANQLRCIGVLWGYGGREELEMAGVDFISEAVVGLVDDIGAQLAALAAHGERTAAD